MDDITDERLREIVEGTYCGFDEGSAIAAELLAARAEIERLREDGNTTAMDLVDERDAARADLREAMELLRAHGMPPDWITVGDAADWNRRYGALLAKHKETP